MKKITTYLILTFLLSSIGYYLIVRSKDLGLNLSLVLFYLMCCPGVSGITTYLIYEKGLSGIGWRLGRVKWLGLAYLLPIVYGTGAYGVVWLSGLAGINPDYRFNPFNLIVIGTLYNVAFASGEEIGWRGFLVPQLYKVTNFTATCLITGIIWSVWHFPLIIYGVYLAKMAMAPQLLLFLLGVTAVTFIISWLRLKSGSVWPAILFHASHNLYIQWLFDPLTTETSSLSKYVVGESGIPLTIVFVVLAVVFWRLRKRLPQRAAVAGRSVPTGNK